MNQQNTNQTVDKLMQDGRDMVKKANKRHIIVRKANGEKLIELNATTLAIIVIAMFFIQPFGTIAAIAAVGYGIYAKLKVEVTHEISASAEDVVEIKVPPMED